MKKSFFLITLFSICAIFVAKSDKTGVNEDCEVVNFYKEVDINYGTKAINSSGDVIEIDKLLIPSNELKDGRYSISVTRKDDNFYKVDGTNIYIETSYCYEYAIMDDAILIVKSYGSRKYGTIIFIE